VDDEIMLKNVRVESLKSTLRLTAVVGLQVRFGVILLSLSSVHLRKKINRSLPIST